MLKTAVLVTAGATLLAPMQAKATAAVDVQTIWAVTLDGTSDASGVFSRDLSGISLIGTGDVTTFGNSQGGHNLEMIQSLANGTASYDAAASGSLEIVNSDPANVGKHILAREDMSGGFDLTATVNYPAVESAFAVGTVTSSDGFSSTVPCGTSGAPGVCTCSGDPTASSCGIGDYIENPLFLAITGVGDVLTLGYNSTIHADLTADPPSVPEPNFPWGFPLLIGAIMLPYVRFGRGLR
jgi:hypothetical protein